MVLIQKKINIYWSFFLIKNNQYVIINKIFKRYINMQKVLDKQELLWFVVEEIYSKQIDENNKIVFKQAESVLKFNLNAKLAKQLDIEVSAIYNALQELIDNDYPKEISEIAETEDDMINLIYHTISLGKEKVLKILKKEKYDERADFVNRLVEITPNVKFDLYGINNVQPIWADSFLKSISNSKMGVNLSRGNPIKYYSSDRLTQLLGNGLLTFIDKKTNYDHFFTSKEMIFYNNLSDLSEKIQKYKKNNKERKTIARNGKMKYFKYFNSKIVSQYIINKTFEFKVTKNFWEN